MADTKPLSIGSKAAYGFGSVAFGVKNGGFDYFLLLFYSQVIGLDPRLVGIAITVALVADALSDPIVGYWSDNLRSRWGRRMGQAPSVHVCLGFTCRAQLLPALESTGGLVANRFVLVPAVAGHPGTHLHHVL
jgi:MFS family permease